MRAAAAADRQLRRIGTGRAAAPTAPPPAPAVPAVLLPEKNLCPGRAEPVAVGSVQWNGWGRDLSNTRYQPEPAIRATDVPKLALKWAFGFQNGMDLGQPTMVDDRLFVTSSSGRIYALDAKTGCTYWTYDAPAGSRTAVSIGELGQAKRAAIPRKLKRTLAHLDVIKAPSAAFFGDDRGALYALDAQKGTLLWKTQIDSHPSARIVGAPILYNDRLYVAMGSTEEKSAANANYSCCTFRGSISAVDIAGGRVLWKSYTVLEEPQPTHKNSTGVQEFGPAGAAISAPPTIDPKRGVLYVSTGRSTTGVEQSLTNAVAAFGLNDGKLRWVKQLNAKGQTESGGFTSPPILRSLASGNEIILAAQISGVVYGLDPDHGGEIVWQQRLGGAARRQRRRRARQRRGSERGWRRYRLGRGGRSPQRVCGRVRTLGATRQLQRQPVGARSQDRRPPLAYAGAGNPVLLERGPLFARAVAGGDGHAGRRFFRIDGRALARLLDHRR